MNPEGSLQAVWMSLRATCLPSFSGVVFEQCCASVKHAHASDTGLCVNQSNGFFCLLHHQVGLSPRVQMEGNRVGFMFPLSWVLHSGIRFEFRESERRQQKTL